MTFRNPRTRRFGLSGRSRIVVPIVVGLVVLFVAFLVLTSIWTNVLWFRSVGYGSVYGTELRTKIVLFLAGGLLMVAVVGVSAAIAYRVRPPLRAGSAEQQGLDRYRAAIDPSRGLIAGAFLVLLGLLTGSSTAGQWRTWLAFHNRTSFGVKDPQYHKDLSFYVFTLPFLRSLVGYLFAVLILATLAAVVVHYLYGGLRLQGPGPKASLSARAHLSVLIGLFVLLKAVAYWLDRWALVTSDRGVVTGASYTDVNAVLPAKTILAVIAVICAALFLVNIWQRGMALPGVGLVLLVLSAVLIGGLYPLLIQQFNVTPNERTKERPYIARDIAATRTAYGVADTQVTAYAPTATTNGKQLAQEASDISGVRLLDPSVVSPTFAQLQQKKSFYIFPDQLDIDRYPLPTGSGGTAVQDTVVAVRGLTGAPQGRRNWVNDHLVYTHGYGLVAAYGSQVTSNGEPDFVAKDMPPKGSIPISEPQVYFGEQVPDYSIVGQRAGQAGQELDYPDESATSGQHSTAYTGSGGVSIGSAWNRLLYSVKFHDKNILLSSSVNSASRVLYDRDPRDRVHKVAPWLTLDGNEYPTVVDGHIVWIVDGYTTTDQYPYSEQTSLGEATSDAITDTHDAVARQSDDQINYIRNSVKATVDAYTGKVTLYAWDAADPILRTWEKAFPGVVKPKSAISADLLAHLRYPEDLFKVQRQILSRYHVTDPSSFYDGGDFWQVPRDPSKSSQAQPAYYQSIEMPGDTQPAFSLTTTFTPRGRANLAAFMSVDSAAGSPSYGRIRILSLGSNSAQPGPGQVQNNFENNPSVAQLLTQLRIGGATVTLGNLLTLPFGGGFLNVEPVYVRAAKGETYPLMRQVLVYYNNTTGLSSTFTGALAQVVAGVSSTTPTPTTPPSGTLSTAVKSAIEKAQQAYTDSQTALHNGDWTAYGKAQTALKDALAQLTALLKPTPTPTPTPSH